MTLLALALMALSQDPAPSPKWGEWTHWGDQGDGTYRNPVLPADFSDLDCIRVERDFYAVSSTFQYSPGFAILHSRDLVNWTILGHAVDDLGQIGPEMTWAKMDRAGRGIWAGAIRRHDGRFWVYFGTPDEGYFMTSAKSPAGPWAPLHPVLRAKGWDDPCPFWDDDGQGYLVGTHFADGYKIHLWKMTPDGKGIVPETDRVIHQSHGSEANKLYKIGGTYYHLFSEVNAEGRVVMMERSKSIWGPYTEVRQLTQADRVAMEPNQGGLVQTPKGDWWWLTHHGTGDWEGRAASLVPVTWIEGWPVIGQPGAEGIGRFVWSGRKPIPGRPTRPPTGGGFAKATLDPSWEWRYQPRREMWSLTERPGSLRLRAFPPLRQNDLMAAGNVLTQRAYRTATNEATACLDLSGMADGGRAGLCHLSRGHSALGVVQEGGRRFVEFRIDGRVVRGPRLAGERLWLRSAWGLDGHSRYSYSPDGRDFVPFGEPYRLAWGDYRGDRIGLYSYNDAGERGYVDVTSFRHDCGSGR